MENKNEVEMTEMEVGNEDWFACWNFHQHEEYFAVGLQQKIYRKMRENKEHYSNEQILAVSSRMYMTMYKEAMEKLSLVEVEKQDLVHEKEELESKLFSANRRCKDLLDILC